MGIPLDPGDPDNEGVILKVEHDGLTVLFVRTDDPSAGDHIRMTRVEPMLRDDSVADLIFAVPQSVLDGADSRGLTDALFNAFVSAAIHAVHEELDMRDNE